MGALGSRVAIVTGAGSGIGRAISLGFAAEGASVAVADISFTETLAMEVARYGVRVNAFTPGVTDTPFWRAHINENEIAEAYRTGQVGQPEDIVPTVVFLCSDAGREISGATVPRQVFVAKGDAE